MKLSVSWRWMMELTASPVDRSLGDDKSFQNLPYGTDLSYTCAEGEGQNGNSRSFVSGSVMHELRFVGSGKVDSCELPAPVIDGAGHAQPCGLATVTMMMTSRGDGKCAKRGSS